MPTNITQGNTARFVVEYLDSTQQTTVPSSGSINIAYIDRISNTATSTDITLTQTNSFFLGTWSSTGAALGLATWTVTGAGITAPAATGQIRVIDVDG